MLTLNGRKSQRRTVPVFSSSRQNGHSDIDLIEFHWRRILVVFVTAEVGHLHGSENQLRLFNGDGTTIVKEDNEGLDKFTLQAIFTNVECHLQQTPVSKIGTNYPFKAYIDTLLETGEKDSVPLNAQCFITGKHDDAEILNGSNTGLYIRFRYTNEGRIQ